jgi:hypothetical protein
VDLAVALAAVVTIQAPPATVFLHDLQDQIPTALRLTASLPQKAHVYLAWDEISSFLACFLSEAPYLVPYFPVIPTFFVRFP